MKKLTTLLLLSLSIFGCSSTTSNVVPVQEKLTDEQLCCVSEGDFPWVKLEKTDSFKFAVDQSTPVWKFENGNSHFSAFEFSELSGTVRLVLKSNMNNDTVFAPQIDLLDENWTVRNTVRFNDFSLKFSDALSKNRYEKTIEVNTNITPYMVIYSNAAQIGKVMTIPHPAKIRAQESGEPMPIVSDPKYRFSHTGELELEVETLSLSGYKKRQKRKLATALSRPETVIEKAPLEQTKNYYLTSIQDAVKNEDIPKALALLEEAKDLNVEGAQEAFVNALNRKK